MTLSAVETLSAAMEKPYNSFLIALTNRTEVSPGGKEDSITGGYRGKLKTTF